MISDYWSETKNKFSNLLNDLKIEDKYFKKPSPSYIFQIVMKTLKKTGFPKNLFPCRQQNFEYFKKHLEHKKKILGKITGLITFIINKEDEIEFNIDVQDILKGKNPEKTNTFLQYLYSYATSKKDYTNIINEYKIQRNKQKYLYKNIEIPKGETKNDKLYLLWIDKNSKNEESQNLLKKVEEDLQYNQINNFEKICLNNIDIAFFLLKTIKFKIVYVIISGELYPEYYHKLKKYKNILKCIPICVIFTTDELKNIYLKRYRHYLLTSDIYESINDSYYNYGGITSDFYSSLDFISNFYFSIKNKFFPKKPKNIKYEGNITFEKINSVNQLIILFLYVKLLSEKNTILDNEIQYFKYMLINRHGDDKVINLITPLLFTKGIPNELMIKFFIRAYTEKSSFYQAVNFSLKKNERKEYLTFVNLLIEGWTKKYLPSSEDDYLYRSCFMSKNKVDKIIEQFEHMKQNKDKSLPAFILYSKCLLSFTKNINIINFSDNKNDESYNIFFKLKNDDKIINKYCFNIDIEDFSIFAEEKEVLILPFTPLILTNIYKDNQKEEKCIIIELEYFGSLENKIKKIKENKKSKEKIKQSFIQCLNNQSYINQLIENNWLGVTYKENNLKEINIISLIKGKIKENFGIEFDEEFINNDGNIYREIIDIEEIIYIPCKKNESKRLEINTDLFYIKENIDIKQNKFIYFFISPFTIDNSEYIWKGKYNKLKEKEGKSKEYDLEGNLIFNGEYKSSQKIKGVEYYIKGNKKYEGDYKNGERLNGILYGINEKNKYEIKSGNGIIKEFHENGCLYFEGEIKNGIKYGKGKLYDETGHLIFEGDFVNNKKHGIGKIYNKTGDLIFEGEFIEGKKGNGNIYIYNDQCELIFEQKFLNGVKITKKYKSIKDYKIDFAINNELCLMEDIHKDNGIEYEIVGEYKYEGEFKNGKKWNGKFNKLNSEGRLCIKGEYKKGKKFFKLFDKKDILMFEGEYINDNEYKGKQYKKGNLVFEGIYKNRKRFKGKEYDNKNMIIFEGTYNDKIRWNGKLKLYTKDFKLIYDGEIKKGKKWNGLSSQVERGLGFEGKYKNGIEWNGSGLQPLRKGKKIFYFDFFNKYYNIMSEENKTIIGTMANGIGNNIKKYDSDGVLLFEGDFFNGELLKGRQYNKNGEIIYEGEYKDGKKYNGIYKIKMNNQIYSYYFMNGKVTNKYIETDNETIYDGKYNNNLKEGKGKEYNKNGKIIFIGEFLNGYRHKGKEFNENGKLIFNGLYKKGLPYNGIRKEFNGNLLKFEGEIQNGLKFKGKEYDSNGILIFEGEFINGIKIRGKEKYTKDLMFEGEYKNGTLYKGKDYDSQNRLRFEGEYKNRKRYEGKEYDENGKLIFEGKYKFKKNNTKKIIENENNKYFIKGNKKEFFFEGEYKKGKKWNGKIIEINTRELKEFEKEEKEKKKQQESNLNEEGRKNEQKGKNNNNKSNFQNSKILSGSGILNQEDIDIQKNISLEKLEMGNLGINKDTEYKYYLNNKLKYEKKKVDNNNYIYVEYSNDGKIIFEGEYLNNQRYKGKEYNSYGDIIFEGQYKYDERYNGKGYNNCSQFNYINGKIDGNIVVYDFIRHELFEGEYKNGEKYNGVLKTYFDEISYMLKREVHIKEGNISEKGKEYYGNGKLKYKGEFQNGVYNGKGTLYYKYSGYINYIGDFKNGEKNGIGKEFDKLGNLIHEGIFKDGDIYNENSL